MSAQELKFKWEDRNAGSLTIKFKEDGRLYFTDENYGDINFDRSEAHLLMLYLQEHLK